MKGSIHTSSGQCCVHLYARILSTSFTSVSIFSVCWYSSVSISMGGTDKWGRKLECWPWLAFWPAQLEDSGPVGVIFTMMGTGMGNPCCLTWQELISCVHLAIQLLVYSTYEFGHDADQSQHSSLRPHWYRWTAENYKNLFWKYEFGIWKRGRAIGILGIYVSNSL